MFDSSASDLVSGVSDSYGGVFRQDLLTGQTELVNVNFSSTAAGNGTYADNASISDDGNLIAFLSDATDLVAGDISYTSSSTFLENVFVRNMETGITQLVSIDPTGTEANNEVANLPEISGNGNEVVFRSNATNLLPKSGPTVSLQLFVRNLTTETTSLATVTTTGGSDPDAFPATDTLSDNGRYLVFVSASNELVPGDYDNLAADMVFLRDLQTGTTSYVDVGPNGSPVEFESGEASGAAISSNGQYVVFATSAGGVVANAPNGGVFVRNLAVGQTQAIAPAPYGSDADSVEESVVGEPQVAVRRRRSLCRLRQFGR